MSKPTTTTPMSKKKAKKEAKRLAELKAQQKASIPVASCSMCDHPKHKWEYIEENMRDPVLCPCKTNCVLCKAAHAKAKRDLQEEKKAAKKRAEEQEILHKKAAAHKEKMEQAQKDAAAKAERDQRKKPTLAQQQLANAQQQLEQKWKEEHMERTRRLEEQEQKQAEERMKKAALEEKKRLMQEQEGKAQEKAKTDGASKTGKMCPNRNKPNSTCGPTSECWTVYNHPWTPCFYFRSDLPQSSCRNGEDCDFIHDFQAYPSSSPSPSAKSYSSSATSDSDQLVDDREEEETFPSQKSTQEQRRKYVSYGNGMCPDRNLPPGDRRRIGREGVCTPHSACWSKYDHPMSTCRHFRANDPINSCQFGKDCMFRHVYPNASQFALRQIALQTSD